MTVDYFAEVQQMNAAQLYHMLQELSSGRTPAGWASGKAFEHIVLRGFELEGAEVIWPFNVQLIGETVEQIDGAVYHGGLSCLVESKDYSEPINVEPIAKLRSQLTRRPPGTLGLVFARSGFTEPAKILTRMMSPLQILLWAYEELEASLHDQTLCRALITKYKYAVEQGMPDYDTREGLR
jgi:hypothetical protein